MSDESINDAAVQADNAAVDAPTPGDSAGPADAPVPAPADVASPVEAPAPADAASPADVPAPVETPGDQGGATKPAADVVHQEKRSEHRIHVRWHAEALIEGHIWHGFVRDISIGGANILLEHNCQNVSGIKLHIHVPPDSKSSAPHILAITGKVIYTAYDSEESLFRSGIKFLTFNSPSDSGFLLSFIAKH